MKTNFETEISDMRTEHQKLEKLIEENKGFQEQMDTLNNFHSSEKQNLNKQIEDLEIIRKNNSNRTLKLTENIQSNKNKLTTKEDREKELNAEI